MCLFDSEMYIKSNTEREITSTFLQNKIYLKCMSDVICCTQRHRIYKFEFPADSEDDTLWTPNQAASKTKGDASQQECDKADSIECDDEEESNINEL